MSILHRPLPTLLIIGASFVGATFWCANSSWARREVRDAWNGARPHEIMRPTPTSGGSSADGVSAPEARGRHADFESTIQPIFTARCVKCHGPDKEKGGLRLDTAAMLFRGDPADHVVIPGKSRESELFRRITLARDHDERMPPKESPLAADEIDAIRRWIDEGARYAQPSLRRVEARSAPDTSGAPAFEPTEAQKRAMAAIASLGGRLTLRAGGQGLVDANLSFVTPQRLPESLDALRPVAADVADLNLARTAVQNEHLRVLEEYGRLTSLHLEGTQVTDEGMDHVARASKLEYLNLHSTNVTDAGIEKLASLRDLKQLYVWQTGVSAQGAASLKESLPDVDVEFGTR